MTIVFYNNKSENNKIEKEIEEIATITGTLRNETSITDPVINISTDFSTIESANYFYIPEFNRYYFINKGIRILQNGIYELSGHVDVLMSFKNEINANTGIIERSETEWNLNLNDGSFVVYQNSLVQTKTFPSGFSGQSFVLAVAGA